jgi:hypothetical protein
MKGGKLVVVVVVVVMTVVFVAGAYDSWASAAYPGPSEVAELEGRLCGVWLSESMSRCVSVSVSGEGGARVFEVEVER